MYDANLLRAVLQHYWARSSDLYTYVGYLFNKGFGNGIGWNEDPQSSRGLAWLENVMLQLLRGICK